MYMCISLFWVIFVLNTVNCVFRGTKFVEESELLLHFKVFGLLYA